MYELFFRDILQAEEFERMDISTLHQDGYRITVSLPKEQGSGITWDFYQLNFQHSFQSKSVPSFLKSKKNINSSFYFVFSIQGASASSDNHPELTICVPRHHFVCWCGRG